MSNSSQPHRQSLRQQLRAQRRSLSADEQQQASQAIIAPIMAHIHTHDAKNVAFYLASDGEIDPLPAIHACWQQGIQTFLPVLHPFRPGHILFLHFTADTVMQRNHYGIQEPQLAVGNVLPLAQLDLLFAPLVGFDTTGHRLGMGGGYYDRTLALAPQLPAIGLAHDCQQLFQVPIAAWDQPLMQIITPSNPTIVDPQ